MKNLLLIVLLIIAVAMIVLGVSGKMLPPTLTGIGFIIIGILIFQKKM